VMAHRSTLKPAAQAQAKVLYDRLRDDLLALAANDPHVFALLRQTVQKRLICEEADATGRAMHRLEEEVVERLTTKGKYRDGGGLILNVSATGTKSWTFVYSSKDEATGKTKEREMGLGSFLALSLSDAREKAAELRAQIGKGRDPLKEKEKAEEEARRLEMRTTFGQAVNEFIEAKQHAWTNATHARQVRQTLTDFCQPFWDKPVEDIDTPDVRAVLSNIWSTKIETAKRLRGRIENVLDFAKVLGWRSGENPARWKSHLENVFASPSKVTGGKLGAQRALLFAEAPKFMADLRRVDLLPALALEFLILTATRTTETLQATWDEIDLKKKLWTLPPSRVKNRKEHVIPLSDAAIAVLRKVAPLRSSAYVFPGMVQGRPLNISSMLRVLQINLKTDVVVHGFRATFKTWTSETPDYANEISEAALNHTIKNAAERAYRRGTLLEKRAELMRDWARYLAPASKKKAPA
jgi:integrase